MFLLKIIKQNWCQDFFDKEKYVFYYENLQFYLRLGLKLKKNRLLGFIQLEWLKPYNKRKGIEEEKR